jgi:phosphatidylethanolamine/phosphatidyl-N-methylethanolamine N-methyltransferase
MKFKVLTVAVFLCALLAFGFKEKSLFWGEFLANPSAVGSVVPSSDELSEIMTETVTEKDFVIELGAGTGPFTKRLAEKLPAGQLFIVENNAAFCEKLKKDYPDQNTLCIDAREIHKHIPKALHGKINVVVSGLPFRSLPDKVADEILESLRKVCAPNVKIIQFTYFNAPPLPEKHVKLMQLSPTYYKESPKNFPGAHVWIYTHTPKK